MFIYVSPLARNFRLNVSSVISPEIIHAFFQNSKDVCNFIFEPDFQGVTFESE